MANEFINRLKFFLRRHKLIKKIIRQPVVAVRKIRAYPDAKRLFNVLNCSIDKLQKSEKIIWYFCPANHLNLGDLAQRYCIENWIEENYKDYQVVEIPSKVFLTFKSQVLKKLKNYITKEHIIIFQSGYTMADMHPDNKVRNIVLRNFNENRILILPQTILYESKKKEAEMRSSLEVCKKLLLLARDKQSYEYAKTAFPNTSTSLYPDIVTTLIGKKYYPDKNRYGIGLCVRNDGEKYYSYDEINKLKLQLEEISEVTVTDTNSSDIGTINKTSIEKAVWQKIESFAQKQVIITDRYHGTIFSLIAGTPVIVIKTKDHKVSTGVKWFEGIYDEYAYYCDNIEDVPQLVKQIINSKMDHKLQPFFKQKYYDLLNEKFLNEG